ncbi:hypothetical protein Trco_000654 [Trichoderma cornu-damae]|uniref:Uncharacterized protein n=1 Tax=Trichoderma cornu-damae TaxID=654480 RepID=A0A9P8QST3_9HYPO|nr:hypothetical protein Trco_000654 [Trichoderma cornu-damae]
MSAEIFFELSEGNASTNSEDAADGSSATGTRAAEVGRLSGLGGPGGLGGQGAVAAGAGALDGSGRAGGKGGLGIVGGGLSRSARGGAGVGDGGGGRGGGRGGGLCGGMGGRGGGGAAVAAVTELDLDALPRAAVVAVDVLLDALGAGPVGAGVVDDGDALVVAQEGALGEVGVAAGPLDGALGGVLAAGDPGSELDLHGGLGKAGGTALGVGGGQGADGVVVDQPGDAGRGPLDRVRVERAEGVGNGVEGTAVTYLIEIVRLEDGRSDDAGAGGSLDDDVDAAEEDVLAGADGRGLRLGADGEDGAVAVEFDRGAGKVAEGVTGTLGEVAVLLVVAQGRVGRAGCRFCNRSLSSDQGGSGKSQSGGGEGLGEHGCRFMR